ncbi:class I adenylate-forming enzyme family protein [Agrobacterium leguminum]|uniref:Acyl-CoA synthase n=1 Tax=Agrobacterium deltaense NCPPB 1641 TaxID=1183425 RepID=A0A1S7U6P9_9HYPH|nr:MULTISPECIES: class I adenylate-forming enzyme family protein [Agrobacterium]WFS68677.1 class I adenylate-forming enzyme family protein [Agrobacterium leguminum]CVI62507.1 putative acyl-CoA synthase [Agrobacterium deltaense NCPPB 1641]
MEKLSRNIEAEGRRLMAPFSGACPLTITATLDRVVRCYPDAEAVVDSATRLTYRELDETVRRFVTQLRIEGIGPGTPVALLTIPSAIHVVTWLALVRIGALPIALHTRESDAGLAAVCSKFDIDILIHDASLELKGASIARQMSRRLARLRIHSAAEPVEPSSLDAVTDANPDAFPPAGDLPVPHEDDPAVIILSSGTTSVPKGIVHTHRNLVEAARSAVAMYGHTGPGARAILPLSTAFTGCYVTWLPMLHSGGCSVFVEKFDLEKCVDTVMHEKITHMALTPTMWRKLLALNPDPTTYASMEVAVFAAEPMDSTTLDRIRQIVTPNVVQAYGSTETLGLATVISAKDMVGDRLLSVGRPFPSTEIRLMTPGAIEGDPVPQGEVGEIWVNSPLVAAGVWQQPELEAKLFHFDGERRWWRSGDLGRFDERGFLFLEGRHDDMIISGGINIMPAAVEEALLQHPLVREAAVVGFKHPEWGEQPHAFVVSTDSSLDEKTLDEFIRKSALSDYQRPRAYHFVASLPYTNSNKINRKALRDAGIPSALAVHS